MILEFREEPIPEALEVPLKQWVAEEAGRTGLTPSGVYERFRRGKYPSISVRRLNQRVVLVQLGTWCQRLARAAWCLDRSSQELQGVPDTGGLRQKIAELREMIRQRTAGGTN